MNYNTDKILSDKTGFVIIAIVILFILFIAFFINIYIPFRKERMYIKIEMERSFSEEEYLFWKRELKSLYFRAIPLIGKFFE